ncbi:MAG: Fpg/Nei family DNA glycosylase, partial [Actinomycetota bacterium]|nr:Fpg/Nei family DNA glycosylase [Actinomycetota bacterium]
MPELPDVEGFRRFFARHARGSRVVRVTAPDPQVLRDTTVQGLGRALRGRRFGAPRRHGKWLFAPTDDGPTVVLHFGMTGRLGWSSDGSGRDRHDRLVLVLDAGELRVNSMRKLGGAWLARRERDLADITGPLGPDALSVTRDQLAARLAGRRGGVKSALMDQAVVAGPGNLVADETLWRARVHPRRPAASLSADELAAVHRSLREVLEGAVP